MSNGSGTGDVGQILPVAALGGDDRVAVYHFEVWDREQQKNVTAPHMGSQDAIRRMKGMADLESMQMVDRAALDERGFYCVQAPPPG